MGSVLRSGTTSRRMDARSRTLFVAGADRRRPAIASNGVGHLRVVCRVVFRWVVLLLAFPQHQRDRGVRAKVSFARLGLTPSLSCRSYLLRKAWSAVACT